MVTGLMEMNHFWLQMEIIANHSQPCLMLIHGTVAFAPRRPHLSLRPGETICGFDHVWFSSASSFPFLVNPSHFDKVGFLPHKLYSVIPCSETFQDFLLISYSYQQHSGVRQGPKEKWSPTSSAATQLTKVFKNQLMK